MRRIVKVGELDKVLDEMDMGDERLDAHSLRLDGTKDPEKPNFIISRDDEYNYSAYHTYKQKARVFDKPTILRFIQEFIKKQKRAGLVIANAPF